VRIALLHLFAWPQVRRGGERYLHELARYLVGRGHEVELVVGSADHVHHQDGVLTTVLRGFSREASPDDAALAARGMLPLLRTRPDVAHAFVPNLALSATRVRRPTVFTLLGYVPPPQHRSDTWRQAVTRADVVAALNPSIGNELEDATGRVAEVLTPGIDLERFALDERPREGPPLLLYSGHLGREAIYKDLDRLVVAFRHVLDRHPEARLQLSGTGDPTWALHDAPGRVRDRVDVLGVGELSVLAERYRLATVTVSAARDEAFGLAFLESLACGTPIVAAPRGGPLAFATEDTGRLAEPSDPSAFAEAVCDAIELARLPGTAARCREHAARWSWDEVGLMHEALYARLSGAVPPRSTPAASAPAEVRTRASVIVPVRDRADLLRACLDGLARQTQPGFEVIVVDDGSSDGSAEVARSFRDRLDVEVVTTPGVGAVEARRRGVAASTAPYLAFTDSDCVPDPDWLAAGVRELDRGADVVQGRTRAAAEHTPLHRTVTAAPADGLYATCNVFYRRSAYDRAGGFDVGLGARIGFRPGRSQRSLGMGEDTALGWKVRRAGRAAHTEDAVVRHHVFPPDLRDDLRRWWMAGGFAGLVREVPELREHFLTGRLLIPGRARLLVLAAAVLTATGRRRWAAIAMAAWVHTHGARTGWRPRWLAHALLRDTVIEGAVVAGSARHRTIVL
jgi:glycosyltransferase involved in cell wall biosynthesis